MAKYVVNYSCGHTGTVQLTGSDKDRKRKIEWLEAQGVCPECYKAQQEAARKAKFEQIQVEIPEIEYAELKGSKKQIAWAEQIRERRMNEILDESNRKIVRAKEVAERTGRMDEINAQLPAAIAQRDEFLRVAASISEAKTWIDHRDDFFHDFLKYLHSSFKK